MPKTMKNASIKAEKTRIERLCSDERGKREGRKHLVQKLHCNGYKESDLNCLFNTRQRNRTTNSQTPIFVPIPFVSDSFQNKFKRIIREVSNVADIPVYFSNKSNNTLRSNLSKTSHITPCNKRDCYLKQDSLCTKSYVVYHATCSICSNRADYVGSSTQFLHERAHTIYRSNIFTHANSITYRKTVLL